MSPESVEAALRELYLTKTGSSLRPEERKKIPEVASLLSLIAKVGKDPVLIDAAAGRAPVGIIAAKLLSLSRVTIIERDVARASRAEKAASKLEGTVFEVIRADVYDVDCWPVFADVVVALHACGSASDAILEATIARGVRWLFLVPCCYADSVPFASAARGWADALGVPRVAAVRRRFIESMIDTVRTLRLQAAGYRVSVVQFVSPTVTPHNLVWRAELSGPSPLATQAEEELARLWRGPAERPLP